jgi:hypothetical protein
LKEVCFQLQDEFQLNGHDTTSDRVYLHIRNMLTVKFL